MFESIGDSMKWYPYNENEIDNSSSWLDDPVANASETRLMSTIDLEAGWEVNGTCVDGLKMEEASRLGISEQVICETCVSVVPCTINQQQIDDEIRAAREG